MYALLVDNLLSFIFLGQLLKFQEQLGGALDPALQRVRRSLYLLCGMTWVGMVLGVVSWSVYAGTGDEVLTAVLVRASLMFAPMAYSGAMVYVHTVSKVFSPRRVSQWSPQESTVHQEEGKCEDCPAKVAILPVQLYRASLMLTPPTMMEEPLLEAPP
ncbi:hypothetical protein HDU86_004275 [Geranomyces michiganensis]|nr:hypothetical protein HDU86_004275 [Geranomyces michiganensis]